MQVFFSFSLSLTRALLFSTFILVHQGLPNEIEARSMMSLLFERLMQYHKECNYEDSFNYLLQENPIRVEEQERQTNEREMTSFLYV